MRINRLTAAVAGLFVLASSVDVEAQVRPRPRPLSSATQGEVRSPFGRRSLGFPVYPKPLDFGGGGQFHFFELHEKNLIIALCSLL